MRITHILGIIAGGVGLIYGGMVAFQHWTESEHVSFVGQELSRFFTGTAGAEENIQSGFLELPSFEKSVSLEGSLTNFLVWAKAHRKVYSSAEERQRRFQIFLDSVKNIATHNARGLENSYRLGLTYFADWTHEEFISYYRFPKRRECWTVKDRENMEAAEDEHSRNLRRDEFGFNNPFLPKQVDWREKGFVSPVKNQGRCGSCWAFAATGALEAQYHKKHGKEVILSEQQMLDCAYGFGNEGCNGGFPARAFEYVRVAGGLNSEETYPYEMVSNSSCRFRPDSVAAKIKRVVNVTEYDERALERAVAFAGPVTAAFVVANDFRLYTEGVYSTKQCGRNPRPKDLTHAILIVGYGVTDGGKKYWIIKNSWGSGWGMQGYFLLERGWNMCGIADCAAYATLE